ncbi:hypothetical protein CP533_5861 [Ophiocordyceps camponoti-saundersi (nom. inval.)]|nr:hypothetical protein CP533_5861 [Ophiocordyceps camponoti-saundersi (nom. inval.)]
MLTDQGSDVGGPTSTDATKNTTTLYNHFPKTLASGPPPSGPFEIDLAALRHEFLRLQAAHHPDKQPPDKKAAAEAMSSDINHAYRTLVDPLLRAQYLLRLRGIDVTDDRSNADDDLDLMELALEAYEAVDAATEPADLQAVRTENDRRLSACERDLQTAFANDDAIAAKRLAVRLLYWVRIREKIEAWEFEALS